MERLSFAEMLAKIEKQLLRDSFVRVGPELFIGAQSGGISPWISLAGSNFSFDPVLGVYSKSVDGIVGRALSKAVPGFKLGRVAVPLFRMTPERISPDDHRIIGIRIGLPGFDVRAVRDFSEWLREVGYAYLIQHSTLQAALELALKWNRMDQAQQYYIPAMMLLLGKRCEREAYVSELLGTYDPRAAELAVVYRKFNKELDAVVVKGPRKTN